MQAKIKSRTLDQLCHPGAQAVILIIPSTGAVGKEDSKLYEATDPVLFANHYIPSTWTQNFTFSKYQ